MAGIGNAARKASGARADAVALRRQLHAMPCGSGDEGGARDLLIAWLDERGIKSQPIAQTGLLAHRPGQGPPILCRADLDALPLQEATEVPYTSTRAGLHHACGHDGHMAMLASALATAPPGADVWALFQPREETGEGMQACLDDGALDKDWHRVWSIHNVPGFPLGAVVVRPGTMALASTGLTLAFAGATSHAAEPELARNAAYAIAEVVPEIGPLLAPGDDPHARASLVGIEVGGPKFGTTAGDGVLWATLRAATDAGLADMQAKLVAHATAAAARHGLDFSLTPVEPFLATINHPEAVDEVRGAAQACQLPVVDAEVPFRWSEDFGRATDRWPGALIGLGAGSDATPLHAASYDFPDALIPHGVAFWHRLMEASR